LSGITEIIAELLASISLCSKGSRASSKTTTIPIKELGGCAWMITKHFVLFNSHTKRENTSRLASLIVIQILARWAGIIAEIDRVSECGGERGRTG